jgi:hypothetical protein
MLPIIMNLAVSVDNSGYFEYLIYVTATLSATDLVHT